MLLLSRCRRLNDRDGPSRLLTEPGGGPWQRGQCPRRSLRDDKPRNRAAARPLRREWRRAKNRHELKALGALGGRQTNSQLIDVILIVHCNSSMPQCTEGVILSRSVQPGWRSGEKAMKNHCAYCHGKFGLVRHRRAFKSFCSQTCVDHYRAWLRAEVRKRKSWSDCLWSASLNVVPYPGERSSA